MIIVGDLKAVFGEFQDQNEQAAGQAVEENVAKRAAA
jgi:hypothetical protein